MDLNAEVDNLVKASQAWIPMIMEYGSRVLLAVITLAVGWWLINKVAQKLGGLLALRNADLALQGFISSLANIILKVLLIVSVASMIGVETTSFVAAIGAAGLAIGLALQGSLANFAGGVLILLFRPFRIGDWIEAQGVAGTVDSIQIFHTVLRTGDNKTIIVPNGNLSNGIITNTNRQPTRKVVFDVGVDYEADLQKAREVLLELAKDPRVLADPAPQAVVSNLGDSSITLSLRVWVKTADYWDVMFMFNEQSRDRLKTAGVDVPFPQRVIRVVQESAVQ
ncbi:small conductance mechanosensitive channel [Pseudomonas sp. IT-P253]|jgi:small conductance mechanosensitive channel|uniref:mechanosensitive ion channel family protein n=1 Tax=Pseudomonas sp. IT-P253 TaxID=3026455 RepID=UPI0039E03235